MKSKDNSHNKLIENLKPGTIYEATVVMRVENEVIDTAKDFFTTLEKG